MRSFGAEIIEAIRATKRKYQQPTQNVLQNSVWYTISNAWNMPPFNEESLMAFNDSIKLISDAK